MIFSIDVAVVEIILKEGDEFREEVEDSDDGTAVIEVETGEINGLVITDVGIVDRLKASLRIGILIPCFEKHLESGVDSISMLMITWIRIYCSRVFLLFLGYMLVLPVNPGNYKDV